MNRITPTEWGEEAYQAKLKQGRPMPIGPAGVPIPNKMAVYRKTIDGQLLKTISTKAYVAWCASELPAAETQRIGEALKRELLLRFPPAEMAVLEKYGFTEARAQTLVELTTREGGDKSLWIEMGEVVLSPIRRGHFSMDMGGKHASAHPPVPADVEDYFRKVVELRRGRHRFDDALHWVGRFKVAKARWPKWIEIEREFPLIGAWLEEQRQ